MIKGVAARGERRKQRENQKKRKREREREQTGREGEGEEGSSVAPHLDPEQRLDVYGGPINGALLRVMKSFFYSLQGRQTGSRECAALTRGIQVLRKERTPNSFKSPEIFSSAQ